MSRHVVIIGAGIAGLSAAFAARQRGLDVTIISTGVGASALSGGAIDDLPWEAWLSAARSLGEPLRVRAVSPGIQAFSDALGLWDLPPADAPAPLVATAAGRLRPARARDKGLLDLGFGAKSAEGDSKPQMFNQGFGAQGALGDSKPQMFNQGFGAQGALGDPKPQMLKQGSFGKTTVLVPRVPRAGWDADALAATLESEWLARQAQLRFLPVDVPVLRFTEEARIADADLAMRHDEPARIEWLAERLREGVRAAPGSPSIAGVLLGSWLGMKHERATELSARVGVPVGEVLVGVGSTAGLRFETARERLLDRLSVKFVAERVTALRRAGERIEVALTEDASSVVADAVVVATGGVAAGSIVYTPPDLHAGEHMPSRIEPSFSFGLQTPHFFIPLGYGSDRIDAGSSVFGPPLDTTAWPSGTRTATLESVGIEAAEGRVCPGVYAAGDVVAGKRRTMLEAVAMGLQVGQTV